MEAGSCVVSVNPFHAKKAKELDDNSPTKNDKKDAIKVMHKYFTTRAKNPLKKKQFFVVISKKNYHNRYIFC